MPKRSKRPNRPESSGDPVARMVQPDALPADRYRLVDAVGDVRARLKRPRPAPPKTRHTPESNPEPCENAARRGRIEDIVAEPSWLHQVKEVEALLEAIDRELGCGKDTALLKALHVFLKLARLARVRETDAATLLSEALAAQDRLPELERQLAEAKARLRVAKRVAEVRRRLPIERVVRHGQADFEHETAAHPPAPQPYGHPYPAPATPPWAGARVDAADLLWRTERRALEFELDRVRRELNELRLDSIRRAAEQSLSTPPWAKPWLGALGAALSESVEGLDDAGEEPSAAVQRSLSPVEIFRRARRRAGGPRRARAVHAEVVASRAASKQDEVSPAAAASDRENARAAEPPASQAAEPASEEKPLSAHDALARRAARAAKPSEPGHSGEVELEPLASSRLPRAEAPEPGEPREALNAKPAGLVCTPISPEPEPRGRAEYTERRVKLPKITF